MRLIDKIEQLEAEIEEIREKYCDYCQEYSCEDCFIEYRESER